ncbi:O-methyltransferase [Streptomyces sp. URMC 126]|uniref:O-methyltransferase n=1 Tax=Streptomyces sp. URMC 126 TaxID=3423401 RepID=UPI003F196654
MDNDTGTRADEVADAVKTVPLTPAVYAYLLAQAEPPTAVQARLIERTGALGKVATMRVPHEQAVFFTLLTRIVRPRLVVEVGTFTGYATLAFALGLPPGGKVITCDVSPEYTAVARTAWAEAGVADRVDLRLGPAAETLRRLPPHPAVDLVFLDADKPGYPDYWETLVPLVRPGGLLLADNALWGGETAAPDARDDARALRSFNERVRADSRVESVVLPIADGLTFARKLDDGERPGDAARDARNQ